ncbi:hypothetical protein L6R29_01510 [Myxococcota bacterium]|nr:hypothetical protein [Myxococcota bacterium]
MQASFGELPLALLRQFTQDSNPPNATPREPKSLRNPLTPSKGTHHADILS